MVNKRQAQLSAIANNRIASFVGDGYNVIAITMTTPTIVKLQHGNGTIITISYDCTRDLMTQRKNGKVIYHGPIIG